MESNLWSTSSFWHLPPHGGGDMLAQSLKCLPQIGAGENGICLGLLETII